ncbi:DnaA ATPase domain-containing protein [Desulfocurvibacter africanus]|uniref:DnaA ATPase domain-containing protein n=1 Tax=Desulfocurvibacter africanus TaxID=873 RepID=UPI0003FF2E4D|nr:DnaA/Hda family protein [Desulfocurvibacter africanus]
MSKASLRKHLSKFFSDPELKRWFDPLKVDVSSDEKRVCVAFPHAFFGDWFDTHARSRFEAEVARFLGPGFLVRYENSAGIGNRPQHLAMKPAQSVNFPFGHQFTLDNFLVNRKNSFPIASAREVATKGNSTYSPFVICGEAGSGKTHLLRAVANEISKSCGIERIFSGSVEDMNQLYASRFRNDPHKARNHLGAFDYLFVDDLQQIRNHPDLQQELILIFNALHDRRKQMVFSCTGRLSSYDFLDPKLKSRLEWGLIVHLEAPDLDIRVRYIQQQLKLRKLQLNQEQILTLSQRFTDFRFLQGILLKLFAFKELMNRDIREREFEQILSHTEDVTKPALTPEAVLKAVADHFKLPVKDVTGSRRHQEVVMARQMAMYLCRKLLGSSYPALGRLFGGKDHSTVLYAVKKIKELQQDDPDMKRLLISLREKCLSQEEI